LGEGGQQQQAAAAQLSICDAAGLAAALEALRQHTALLEEQGVLPPADNAPGGAWPLAASTWDVPGSAAAVTADLPPYLQRQQQQQEQQWEAAFQHWPAVAAAAATGGVENDAIQEADDGGCCAANAACWQTVAPWKWATCLRLLSSEVCCVCCVCCVCSCCSG
jgi:hypothetical protein